MGRGDLGNDGKMAIGKLFEHGVASLDFTPVLAEFLRAGEQGSCRFLQSIFAK